MNTSSPRRWRRKRTVAALVGAGLLSLGCSVGGDLVSYDLPEEPARYTFETETGGVTTVWEYTSARPAEDGAPEAQPCLGEGLGDPSPGPCRPEPLIFLRYDLGLDLDNTAPAGRHQQVTVTGYYQERLTDPPAVTELGIEVSHDGGETWEEVRTRSEGENTFTAKFRNPRQEDATVGLQINAEDSDGNTVVQTMPEAYPLR